MITNGVEEEHVKFITMGTVLIDPDYTFIITSDNAEFLVCEEEVCTHDCNSLGVLGHQHEFIWVFLYCTLPTSVMKLDTKGRQTWKATNMTLLTASPTRSKFFRVRSDVTYTPTSMKATPTRRSSESKARTKT